MKKQVFYAVLLAILAGYVFTGAQVYQASAADSRDDAYQQLEIFSRVLERVRRDYVDGDKVTYSNLVQSALKGMLNSLDPHSEFMPPVKYEELREETQGTFSGVGLQVGTRDGTLTVIAPIEDTPAFRAGILAGDRIVKIEGKSTEGMTSNDAVTVLRGPADTKVTITIERASLPEPKDIELTRAPIQMFTAKDIHNTREFPVDDNKIGYVRLTQFGEHTDDELEEALRKLEKQDMAGLILDLRGNPGGLLDQAVSVSEKFLERGQPIVSTEGRTLTAEGQRRAGGGRKRTKLPLAILVNGGSASAAEIVTGALQDLKRAVIVGEQTFGKGSVQSILPLPDGSALRLTTAKYYTPSHREIHEKGIKPDIIVPLDEDEEAAIQLRRVPGGELVIEDILKTFPEERRDRIRELVADQRDPQLERAVDLLKGVNLFGQRQEEKARVEPVGALN